MNKTNLKKPYQLVEQSTYFTDFDKYEGYSPNSESLCSELKGIFIESVIDHGDSGEAYLLSNGDVLKITTNAREGEYAKWLVENPHPLIANYKHVWQDGNLYYVIMEYLDTGIPNYLKTLIDYMREVLDSHNCFNVDRAVSILIKDEKIQKLLHISVVKSILSYIDHIRYGGNAFDFLSLDNVGLSDGKIKFFDIS